jgi:hypothetical protein
MATLASQALNRAGLTPSFAAATGGGDAFTPDNNTFLRVKNASGSPITVTVVTPRTNRFGNAIADNTFSVPATTGDVLAGPFPAEEYADPANSGLTTITYSGVTSLTIAAIQIQQP